MQKNWILIAGLTLLILAAGCTTQPAPAPVGTTLQTPQHTQITQAATVSTAAPGAVAKTGDTVSVLYTGSFDNGTIFDSNENGTPLTFVVGKGSVIPGFENAIPGMKVGETRSVHIPAQQAYGDYIPALVRTVNRSPTNDMVPVVGQYVSLRRPSDGAVIQARIINVTDTTFTYDANSPLAGQSLNFAIRLVGIQ